MKYIVREFPDDDCLIVFHKDKQRFEKNRRKKKRVP